MGASRGWTNESHEYDESDVFLFQKYLVSEVLKIRGKGVTQELLSARDPNLVGENASKKHGNDVVQK